MTALAMIIGMAPMALGLGEGGEQNAPLGRAVVGGLIFATIATLMFVPVVFSLVDVYKRQDPRLIEFQRHQWLKNTFSKKKCPFCATQRVVLVDLRLC